MIFGVGIDIVYIPRIIEKINKFGDRFLNKVFNVLEIKSGEKYNDFEMKARHFAKRFAAKEALVKALGRGFSSMKMSDIVLYNNIYGKPEITFLWDKDLINSLNIQVSLSDEKDYATAIVIIEKKSL